MRNGWVFVVIVLVVIFTWKPFLQFLFAPLWVLLRARLGPSPNVQKLLDRSDAWGLFAALQYKKTKSDFMVSYARSNAAKAWWQLGQTPLDAPFCRRAARALIRAMQDPDQAVRTPATGALATIGPKLAAGPLRRHVLGALVAALRTGGESTMRTLAAQGLGQVTLDWARQPLLAAYQASDQAALARASATLSQIAIQAFTPLQDALHDGVSPVRAASALALGMLAQPNSLDALREVWQDPATEVRQAAVNAAGLMGDPRASELLIQSLRDYNQSVRSAAAAVLEGQRWQPHDVKEEAAYCIAKDQRERCAALGRPALDLLVADLSGAEQSIRQATMTTLAQIGTPAVEPLIVALQGRSQDVRQAAGMALVQVGVPAVVPLIAVLADEQLDARQAAAQALGQIGDRQAIGPLVALLGDQRLEVRSAAAAALERLGWTPDRSEAGAAYWAVKREWDKCVAIGAPAFDALAVVLSQGNTGERQAAAEALGRLGDGRAIEPLVAALKDADAGVRRASVEVLGRLGDGRAVEPLGAVLKDKDMDVCRASIKALGCLGDGRALKLLATTLVAEDRGLRPDIVRVLDKLGWQVDRSVAGAVYWVSKHEWDKCVEIGAPAVEPLIAVLNDYDMRVRRAAAGSLVAIYRRGGLGSKEQGRVLAQRETITRAHYDSRGAHEDWGRDSNDCGHTDERPHDDHEGIGIPFPI